jgi:predicted transcriptional regulator YdeE
MEKYSHGAFQVTGLKITTTNKNDQMHTDIGALWEKFMAEKVADKILHKAFPGLHMVYFNYTNPENFEERGYDVLMGYVTEENSTQTDPSLITINILAQDYEYVTVNSPLPENLIAEWKKVNSMTKEECNRVYGYDLDMYGEDMKTVTLTVSVNK